MSHTHNAIGMGAGASRVTLRSSRTRGGTFRIVTLLAIFAMAFGGLISAPSPASAASATATANLNLRSGPGTSYAVIAVIPEGASVETTGAARSGFLPVTYGGRSGYASADYLSSSGGGETVDSDGPTGTRYVTGGLLNFRSGPSTADSVIGVLPNGAAVQLTGRQSNGFAAVTYNGRSGWAFLQYLSSSGGTSGGGTTDGGSGSVSVGDSVTGRAITDGRLNLRRGPGTSYAVISVMPSGAAVELMGSAQSGFYPVRYSGTKGWASADYLRIGGTAPQPDATPTPTPGGTGAVPVGPSVTDNKVTTAALNMRQGPSSSYAVVIVLPPGTQVDIMGAANGNFLPVRWAGRTGWAHGDWLVDPGSTPDPDSGAQPTDIIQIIYNAADRWGQPRADMLRVARCESNLDPRAVNSSSGASGLFQFMPSTFAFTPNGKAGQNIFDPVASADAAGWMWANGMRNHWACQ